MLKSPHAAALPHSLRVIPAKAGIQGSWRARALGYALAAALAAAGVDAAARGLVPPGRYAIVVTQELPNAKAGEPIKLEACLTKEAIASAAAFHVRSEIPIRECPQSDVRFNGEELIYRIICPQADVAAGRAKFVNTRTGYEGTITLKTGNVVVTERQRAQRIGECPNDDSASVLRIDEQHWRDDRPHVPR